MCNIGWRKRAWWKETVYLRLRVSIQCFQNLAWEVVQACLVGEHPHSLPHWSCCLFLLNSVCLCVFVSFFSCRTVKLSSCHLYILNSCRKVIWLDSYPAWMSTSSFAVSIVPLHILRFLHFLPSDVILYYFQFSASFSFFLFLLHLFTFLMNFISCIFVVSF